MPLTFASPVAVLPLVGRTRLPTAALVAGALVPDVPLFLRFDDTYELTHSLGGLLGVDTLIGSALVAIWAFVARAAWADLAPDPLRDRLSAPTPYTSRDWWLTPVAVCAGAAAHLGWDQLAVPEGWGSRHIPWLAEVHGGLLGATWLQLGSGALAAAALIVVALRLKRLPLRPPSVGRVLPRWSAALAVTVVVLMGLDTIIMFSSVRPGAVMYEAAANLMATAGLVLVAWAVAWHVRRSCRGRTRTWLA